MQTGKRAQNVLLFDFQYVVSPGKDAFPVNITMAPIADGAKEAQWELKRVIQLNRYELTQCCAVLFGLEKEMRQTFTEPIKTKVYAHQQWCIRLRDKLFSWWGYADAYVEPCPKNGSRAFILKRQADAWDMSVSDVLALLRQSSGHQTGMNHEAGSRTGLPRTTIFKSKLTLLNFNWKAL